MKDDYNNGASTMMGRARPWAGLGTALILAALPVSGTAWAQVIPMQSPVQAPAQAPAEAPGPAASGSPGGESSPMADRMPSPMACPSDPVELPPELAAWNQRTRLLAARDTRSLSGATIAIGKGIEGGLRPTPEMRYAQRPEKPGGSVSFGGLYTFDVAEAGSYRVALGSAAWIDVIKAGKKAGDGTAMTSTAHGHGPDCSGIRKMVDFTLEPGTYLLQVSANADDRLPLLVARLP
ncbi:homogentisate 1,2-dioxygenase [Novosphingobium sp. ST904]|uniref:homogentisate 1,2-dioxygenase n=1 Tax=Novosphingobium sp. ST904 TaxID=1684385 RepID=UPI000AC3B91B|nr:homogentisate 1,2-dioxygenase [Novosphingobium sp. ST904]TCM25165.1 hypothetical protein EDF59_14427 [Novosphingobium sp. ST904]